MKVRFNRQEMADALAAASSVAAVRTPKEILKCVRLDVMPDVLMVSATDLELSLRWAVTQVEVDKPGEVLVVADTLSRIVRECPDEVLTAELSQNQLHIRGQGSHFRIVTQAVSEFPPVPNMEGEPDFRVDQAALQRLIEWTVFAAARESTRYAINGVLWEINGDDLTLAATDGRRLSVGKTKVKKAHNKAIPSAIVPLKALTLFAKLPAETDAVAQVKITGNQMLLKVGRELLSTNLVEGHFPKYQDVIPSDCDRDVTLDTQEFLSALKRASLLTNEESKGVRLSFNDKGLTLSSRAPEQGEATISLPLSYQGDAIDIGFNPVFLTDVLRAVHTDEITFAMKEPNRPGLIKISKDFLHVVMPVNLDRQRETKREPKPLQDRRLYWVARNRSWRDRTKSAGSFVADLTKELEASQGDMGFILDAVRPLVDDDFRRHCRLGSVANGVLVIFVHDAGMVAAARLRWAEALLRGLHGTREGTRIRRIHFEYGNGGADFLPPDKRDV